jgi:hypothetical protein
MRTTQLISLLTLLSTLSAIKIKIPTGGSGGAHGIPLSVSPVHPPGIVDPSYHLIKTCDAFTPSISGADLLAYYSQDLYNNLRNMHDDLIIVRHEIQKVMGYVLHRIVYRMGGSGSGHFIGLKIKVSSGSSVSVISYIQSVEYSEVCRMMGFPDVQMFNYPCGNLKRQCLQAFVRMASRINVCSGTQNVGPFPGNVAVNPVPVVAPQPMPISVTVTHQPGNKGGKKRRRRRRRRKRKRMRKMRQAIRRQKREAMDDMLYGDDMSDFAGDGLSELNDSGSGPHIQVGSSRP